MGTKNMLLCTDVLIDGWLVLSGVRVKLDKLAIY